MQKRLLTAAALSLSLGTCLSSAVQAGLVLTSAGVTDGFSLSTFASGFPSRSTIGPLGIAVNSAGKVIVNSSGDGKNYIFNDTNGQTPATALSSVSGANYPAAYAFSNGSVWGSTGFSTGQLIKLNNDGTTATTYNVPVSQGLWTNPVNGHLLATGSQGIIDIDVSGATPTYRSVNLSVFSDGVTVSPDGTIIYTNGVGGYRISDGVQVYANVIVPGADGTGVISGGALNGDIVVNTNSGELWLLDALGNKTLIANGGSRGDYVAPDYSDGTLFVTQTDSILRLTLAGGGIGGPPVVGGVPEPSTWAMMLLGFAGVGFIAYRRKAKPALFAA
jgi:hypothetical protein